jgi:hypothetical protein
MKKYFALALLAPIALIGCQSSSTSSLAVYSLNYASGAAQSQVIAAGSSANLGVNVSVGSGGNVSGLSLTASVNNGYCTLASGSATTDASGNASFSVSAGPASNLSCTVTVGLPSVVTSRGTLGFSVGIRGLQRALTAPAATLSVPTTPTATSLDLSKVS